MKEDKKKKIRLAVQIASFAFALFWLVLIIAGSNYVIHQICPYAVVCFGISGATLLNIGGLVMAGAIIFSLAVLVYTMFYGRRFCAWLCPLGSLQEWIYSIRSKKYRMKHRAPYYVDRRLAWIKYAILAVTSVLSVLGLGYLFIRLCPFYSLAMLPRLAIPGLVIIALIIVKSFFGEREWLS